MNTSTQILSDESAVEPQSTFASDRFGTIDIDGDVITLDNFEFRNGDVAGHLARLPAEEQPAEFIRMVEVGGFCLERASSTKDTEFVKRQVERLLNDMESRVGSIPRAVQDELLKKVGTGDGQVLKPLVDATQIVSKALGDRIMECKTFVNDVLDPSKDTSSAGKILKTLTDLLDPRRKDSVQGSLDAAVTAATGEDGALAKAVKMVVGEAIKPLKEEVDSLAKEIRGREAAEEALMQTTEKGVPYELEVVDALRPWAKSVGAQVEHVGCDNRPGDVVVQLTTTSIASADFCLVIEARDRNNPVGRKAVSDELTDKMAERSSNAALYLSRNPAGLGREIGDWSEGDCEAGPWVATTHEHLHTAIRFLMALHRLRTLRSDVPELDGAAIENQIERIRTALNRIKTINRKVSDVRSTADDIGTEAGSLREEVRDALIAIEDAIRQADSSPN